MNKFRVLTGQAVFIQSNQSTPFTMSQLIDHVAAYDGDSIMAKCRDGSPIIGIFKNIGHRIIISTDVPHLDRNGVLMMLRDMSLPDNHVPSLFLCATTRNITEMSLNIEYRIVGINETLNGLELTLQRKM